MKGYDRRFGIEPKEDSSGKGLSTLQKLAIGLVVLAIVLALV